jgi:hypothetical protein
VKQRTIVAAIAIAALGIIGFYLINDTSDQTSYELRFTSVSDSPAELNLTQEQFDSAPEPLQTAIQEARDAGTSAIHGEHAFKEARNYLRSLTPGGESPQYIAYKGGIIQVSYDVSVV